MTAWLRLARLRRILTRIAIGAGALAILGMTAAAIFVATRDLGALRDDVLRTIEHEAGARLTLKAARPVFWPRPHIVLDDVSIATSDQGAALTAPRMLIHIDLVDLLDGRIDKLDLRIESPEIRITTGPISRFYQSPRGLTGLADALSGAFAGRGGFSALRVEIHKGRIAFREGADQGNAQLIEPVDARLRYSHARGRIDIFARRNSDIRPVEMTLSLPTRRGMAEGKRNSASLSLSGYGSRAAFSGRMTRNPELALDGSAEIAVQDALEQALGYHPPGKRLRDETILTASASVRLDQRGGNLEALKISRGKASLSGIAALRENGGRWGISSTLAGDLVDGSATQAALQRLMLPDGTWSSAPLDIDPVPGVDLDIRLSTRAFRLGRLLLEDAALSIFTRAGRAEFAIADARFGAGSVKARALVTDRAEAQDLKLLVSGERIDGAAFLDAAFGLSRLRGTGGFVIQVESHGRSVAELAQNLGGAGAIDLRNGEILGIDINRLMARSAEMRPEAALLAALGGKSPFESLHVNVAMRNGRLEPVGASLKAPRFEGTLDGGIDLASRQHQLWGILKRQPDQLGLPGEFFAVRIDGPLFAPTLKPDPAFLLRRS